MEDEPSDCVAGVKRKPRAGAGAAFRVRCEGTEVADSAAEGTGW